jgi:hypothetical protein
MTTRMRQMASGILVALGALFLINLSLDWHGGTTLDMAGIVQVHSGASGWAGWGALAGAAVICLVILEVLELTAETAPPKAAVLWVPLLSLVTLAATVAAFVDRSATVSLGGMIAVTTNASREWPAYAGLVLAILIAIVAVWRVIAETDVGHATKGLTA